MYSIVYSPGFFLQTGGAEGEVQYEVQGGSGTDDRYQMHNVPDANVSNEKFAFSVLSRFELMMDFLFCCTGCRVVEAHGSIGL